MDATRRKFMQRGITGLGAIVLGGTVYARDPRRAPAPAPEPVDPRRDPAPDPEPVDPRRAVLVMREALVEMVDLTLAPMWLFDDGTSPRFPGPVIYVTEGDEVFIDVTNALPIGQHAFAIPGVVDSGPIAPGETRTVSFPAPAAGTYLYLDPLNDPVNRAMGLHGVLVSLPREGNTPYTDPTLPVFALFQDLGWAESGFPGHPWQPKDTVIWVFHQVDPGLNNLVAAGELADPGLFAQMFQPRYFTINGRSGYFVSHPGGGQVGDASLRSTVGHPHLIRNVNTGLWAHSPHTHANHCYQLAINGLVQDNVFLLDTWTIKPMERKDLLFPFIVPPDIPQETWNKVVAGTQEEPFPMMYPMHCHMEVANTAAGGNYPQGMVSHIEFLGPIDQIAAPGNPPPGYPWPLSDNDHL